MTTAPTHAVLVLNAGSSTIKYRLDGGDRVLASGLVERIGEDGARLVHRPADGDERVVERPVADHADGFRLLFAELGHPADALLAVGHRIVHGGDRFTSPALVDDAVLAELEALTPLAPLHNPAGTRGIEVAREHYPAVPQVAVFDTAFHHTMPARAHLYALPRDLADRYRIRRYGFHGISHGYVARRAAEHLERQALELNLVTLHLGNGASAAAIAGGRSIDTSMGLTPLSGLVMGTRGGDVDPGVVFHLHREAGMPVAEIDRAAPAHARRAAAVQAPRLHPRAGRAGRGRVGVAGVGLDTGNTPNRSVQHRGEGPYSPSRPRCIVDPTEGDGQDMIEITEDAPPRRSFVQAEVRAFPNDHLDDTVTWASGPAR